MRQLLALSLILVGLSGCAVPHATAPYGNFIQSSAKANDAKVVDDVMRKLVVLYPPASTRFDLQHATPDYFGTSLVESLRATGYAVLEFQPAPTPLASATHEANAASQPAQAETVHGLPLSYIVDQGKSADMYRVTLIINRQQSLDRAYQIAQDGVIYPAGYWVRKE